MSGPLTLLVRLILTMSLLVASFLVLPVSDAMACSAEPVAVHQTQSTAAMAPDADSDANGFEVADRACAHGHCHHSSAFRAAMISDNPPAPARPRHERPRDEAVAPSPSDGLIRPPRD